MASSWSIFNQPAATQGQWVGSLIHDLGVPDSPANQQFIWDWMKSEGGGGTWNPLNQGAVPGHPELTTGGAFNSSGVGNYVSEAAGLQGSVDYLNMPNYANVLAAMKSGQSYSADTSALFASPWAAGHYGYGSAWNTSPFAGSQGTPVPASGDGSGSQQAANVLQSQMTPQEVAQLQQELGVGFNQAAAQQMAELQRQLLTKNYNYQQAQYWWQNQQLGLSQTAEQQAVAHNAAQYKIQQEQDVLSGQAIQANINNILQQYGVQTQQLGQARQETTQQSAASGVLNTGTQRQAMKSYDLQAQAAQISEQFSLLQQKEAQQQLGLTEQQQKEQYGYTNEQLQNGLKQIKIQQQQLGITERQAKDQYNNALSVLGLQGIMTAEQLNQEIGAMAGGGYSPFSSAMGTISSVLPWVTSGLFAQPGSTGTGSTGG